MIEGIAREMRRVRGAGEKIVAVLGPAVVHSGGDVPLAALVREGWIDELLAGKRSPSTTSRRRFLRRVSGSVR